MALGLTPREQEEQVLALLLREAREQGLAPRPVLFARLALYFLSARRAIDRPWVSMVNALTEAVRTGQLVVVDLPNGPWYQPPDLSRIRYSRSEARKVPLFAQWRESATILKGSQHAERLWAAAFELGGWVVPQPHSVRIPCPLPDDPERDHKQSHEIDVFATKGGNVVAWRSRTAGAMAGSTRISSPTGS